MYRKASFVQREVCERHPWCSLFLFTDSQIPLYGYATICFSIHAGGASGKEPTCQCRKQETRVRSLGQEDPPEEGMATHSSILAWRIPWTEKHGGPSVCFWSVLFWLVDLVLNQMIYCLLIFAGAAV